MFEFNYRGTTFYTVKYLTSMRPPLVNRETHLLKTVMVMVEDDPAALHCPRRLERVYLGFTKRHQNVVCTKQRSSFNWRRGIRNNLLDPIPRQPGWEND